MRGRVTRNFCFDLKFARNFHFDFKSTRNSYSDVISHHQLILCHKLWVIPRQVYTRRVDCYAIFLAPCQTTDKLTCTKTLWCRTIDSDHQSAGLHDSTSTESSVEPKFNRSFSTLPAESVLLMSVVNAVEFHWLSTNSDQFLRSAGFRQIDFLLLVF